LAWENLLAATHQASKGKRHRPETQAFSRALTHNLVRIQDELRSERFVFGRFHQFLIHDPKERLITAPSFEERVVHHAIINICEPYFERLLIADTFACRRGLGRLAALSRVMMHSRRDTHYLKIDVRKYFDSVHLGHLVAMLQRRFKDQRLLRLFESIIGAYRSDAGCGLPIGSLTSQHFANFYLSDLDRFVKERLRVKGYVRYMDDCLLWGGSRADLNRWCRAIAGFLHESLHLETKRPIMANVNRGIDFLGARVFPDYMVLNRRSRRRYTRKMMDLTEQCRQGQISPAEFQRRSLSTSEFTCAGGVRSWKFRRDVLRFLVADD
jgi:retron-type reverse transcriptase